VENAAKAREIRQRLRGLRAVGRGRVPAIPRRYPARFGARHWQALCFFDLKEHFVAIGLGLLATAAYRRTDSNDLIVLGGGRQLDGHDVELATWTAAQAEDWLGRWAKNLMLINVSTRKLKRAVFSYFSPERRQQLGASSTAERK
jgi:hypothetical protein